MERFDFAIIGAGAVGAWTAFELSKCSDSVCVLESENDCCMGTSKANSAIIHAGYDPAPGSLMAHLNVRGNKLVRELHGRMAIPFKQVGSLVAAFDDEGLDKIRELYARGIKNGVEGLELLGTEDVISIEPGIGSECLGALYAPTAGICSPFELTAAPLEISIVNGVVFKRNFKVTAIDEIKKGIKNASDEKNASGEINALDEINALKEKIAYHRLTAENGEIVEARIIINAAGVHADEVARMAGDESFHIHPRRGEYLLFDKCAGDLAKHVIFQPPTSKGKGVLVTPTVDGNLLTGPDAQDIDDKGDTATTADGQDEVFNSGLRSIPAMNRRDVINSFAGLRAVSDTGDFIIGFSKPWFLNIAGICSPGLTAAPAIGEYAVRLIEENLIKENLIKENLIKENLIKENLIKENQIKKDLIKKEELCDEAGQSLLRCKESFADSREVLRFREMNEEERHELILRDPLYGRVICRCESVTEGEIVDSIRRPAGAADLDGVKRRTGAGMGRCQSGFCGPKVMEILARELGMDYTDVTKFGRGSWMTAASEKFAASGQASSLSLSQVLSQSSSLTLDQSLDSSAELSADLPTDHKNHTFDNAGASGVDTKCSKYQDAPDHVQVAVIGGGPAGLSAALECWNQGIRDILIIERDSKLGGILNQCIHPGFGLHVFGEELTGPEYAQRYINMVRETGIRTMTDAMVLSVSDEDGKVIRLTSAATGIKAIRADAVILAMGCRERTRGMLQIPGTRPSGIYTAGTAQQLVNVEGFMPGREVVILGSGDIGLIMARRMTLEGAHVKAVYEVMDHSGGLKRNIVQCLEDFDIPLYFSMTAVKIHGTDRVTGITVARVDEGLRPVPGTEEYVACDTVLLSCGLIPENELTRGAGIEMDPRTRGPVDKGDFMTSIPGIFACGNVLKVYDLADNVTKDSVLAGQAAAKWVTGS